MAKTVLIIDDDPVMMKWFSVRLKASGYDVLTASDGLSGLEIARQKRPDVITLDVVMPELNGYSLCGFLRDDSELCNIPIIMITARQGECDSKFDNDYSPNAFLTKPFDMEDVLEKIEFLV